MADFTQQLSQLHEQYAEDLQLLVEAFRKRNIELKKERYEFRVNVHIYIYIYEFYFLFQ